MLITDEKTAIVGVAELRDKTQEVLKEAKTHNVILTRRNKPVGVIIAYEEYERMKRAEEELEDIVLGHIAHERSKRKGRKVVSLEEAEDRVGLRQVV